ncbi:hypothetical protein RNZ50_16250 [Paracoccaceae bacterium Fryx2]|nr:hypothetical protein [Paracoccaceae bacterium Fryx2]
MTAAAQMAELSEWLAASSRDGRSPFGDTIPRSPFGQLVGITLDDLPPDLTAAIALGCLPLLVASDVPEPTFAASEGQPRLGERAAHVEWLSGAAQADPLRGFPACAVVRVAQGQTLRQAALAGGFDPDADRLLVGIPATAF